MKQKIMIFGGARFVGYELVEKLNEVTDNEVYVLNRGRYRQQYPPGINHIKADRNNQELLKKVIGEINPEIVIDNNGYNPDQIRILLQSFTTIPKQYIFTSSGAVYKLLTSDKPVKEHESELNQIGFYDKKILPYANGKLESERFIRNNFEDIPFTIIRFPNIFGEKDFSKKLTLLENKIFEEGGIELEEEVKEFSAIYSLDAVKVFEGVINNRECFNKVINAADRKVYDYNSFFKGIFGERYNDSFVNIKPAIELENEGKLLPFAWGPPLDTGLMHKLIPQMSFKNLSEWGKKSLEGEKNG